VLISPLVILREGGEGRIHRGAGSVLIRVETSSCLVLFHPAQLAARQSPDAYRNRSLGPAPLLLSYLRYTELILDTFSRARRESMGESLHTEALLPIRDECVMLAAIVGVWMEVGVLLC
jgi:hypothetical protein